VGCLHQWVQNNIFLNNSWKVSVGFRILKRISHKKITCHCFPVS
jgi:hypothetical protein